MSERCPSAICHGVTQRHGAVNCFFVLSQHTAHTFFTLLFFFLLLYFFFLKGDKANDGFDVGKMREISYELGSSFARVLTLQVRSFFFSRFLFFFLTSSLFSIITRRCRHRFGWYGRARTLTRAHDQFFCVRFVFTIFSFQNSNRNACFPISFQKAEKKRTCAVCRVCVGGRLVRVGVCSNRCLAHLQKPIFFYKVVFFFFICTRREDDESERTEKKNCQIHKRRQNVRTFFVLSFRVHVWMYGWIACDMCSVRSKS